MQELVDFIARYRPEYPATVAGASAAEIAALEEAAGRSLPADYRDFLRVFGRSAGEPKPFAMQFDTALDEVLRFFRKSRWKPPPPFLLIGRDRSGSDMDLCLDLDAAEPRVVLFQRWWEPGEPMRLSVVYQSLPQMLFSQSFLSVRLPLLPHQATFVSGAAAWDEARNGTRLGILAAIGRELELPLVPHAAGWAPCYDAGEIALAAYQPEGSGLFLQVGAADGARLALLERILVRRLQLVRSA